MNHLLAGICLGSQPVEGGFSPVMSGDEFGRQHCPPATALLELQMTLGAVSINPRPYLHIRLIELAASQAKVHAI
jgi:hypothetical protein